MANPLITPALDLSDIPADTGPRKLVRPHLPEHLEGKRPKTLRQRTPLLAHQEAAQIHHGPLDSQAELFYFQKQMQAQTSMVFVLDDGERIEGVIEWYDLHVIKVRHTTRTMIYKSSIKYLFKSSEAAGAPPPMHS